MAFQQSKSTPSSSSITSTSSTDASSSPSTATEIHLPDPPPPPAPYCPINVDESFKEEVYNKLMNGQYQTLEEMVTDINGVGEI